MHGPCGFAGRACVCLRLRGGQSRHHHNRRAMTAPLLMAMPGNEAMTRRLAATLAAAIGEIELRAFPDGETYLRFVSNLSNCTLILVCTLDRPNEKILPLLFA